jgi:hypothetical protein
LKVSLKVKVYSVSLVVGSNLVWVVRWNAFEVELVVV